MQRGYFGEEQCKVMQPRKSAENELCLRIVAFWGKWITYSRADTSDQYTQQNATFLKSVWCLGGYPYEMGNVHGGTRSRV